MKVLKRLLIRIGICREPCVHELVIPEMDKIVSALTKDGQYFAAAHLMFDNSKTKSYGKCLKCNEMFRTKY